MEGTSNIYTIRYESNRFYIESNTKQENIIIIEENDIINYLTESTIDKSEIINILIKCINLKECVVIPNKDDINISCYLHGTLSGEKIEFSLLSTTYQKKFT